MKQRFLLKTMLLLCALIAGSTSLWGQSTATFTPSDFSGQGTASTGSAISATVSGVTFACNRGYGTTEIRCYSGSKITISSANTITAISFTFSGDKTGGLETSYSNLSTTSWEKTLSSQARFSEITVTYTTGGGDTPTETVATPQFNPAAGTYTSVQNVEISTTTSGATIYYTTDGTTPTTSNNVYSSAINVSTTTTIKAMAVKENMNNSAVATATYTINAPLDLDDFVRVNSLKDLTDGAKVIIAARYDSDATKYYAMTASATGKPTGVAFESTTSNNGEIVPATILNSAGTYYWTVGVTNDGYTFTNASDKMLGYTSSTNFAENGDNTEWIITRATSGSSAMVGGYEGFYITNKNNTGRGIALNNSHNYGPYATSNNNNGDYNFYLDIFVEGATSSDPTITASNVNVAYDATSGSIAYTINNEPSSAGTLTAAITAGNDGSWLSLGTVTSSAVPFTCSANSETTERTATVTLTYTYGDNQTVTKAVTVTQAGDPDAVNNISDITAVSTAYIVRGTVVATNSRGFVIGDGTGYVYYYKNAAPTQSVGDMVTISGTTGSYGHIIQFPNTATITEATTSNYNNTPTATIITAVPDYTEGYHLSTYLQFEGSLTKSSSNNSSYYFISVGGTDIQISYPTTAQGTTLTALDGKKVLVKGYFSGINSSSKFTVMLESVEEVVTPEPSITVTPTSVKEEAGGGGGTITVTYYNITTVVPEVKFYEADGTTEATYNWITADVNSENNVEYLIYENTGNARTAYMKVWTYDDDHQEVYSNLITITQAKAGYATLPFSFNGGKADIENTSGLTQSGLGQDYNSQTSPNTRLKFDDTDDCLILKINDEPVVLSFNIKGNSYSGTFKVQTSADGTNYKDLNTYTILDDEQEETFSNLPANTRYIKWIYTTKSTGNVGLGNIYVGNETTTATISPTGWSTYCSAVALDFSSVSGLEAYIATGVEGTKVVTSAPLVTVPENTPLLLKGTANTEYDIPVIASSTTDVSGNKLVAGTGAAVAKENGVTRYVLSATNDGKAVFKMIDEDPATVPVGKAYLEIEISGNPPAPMLSFDLGGDTTGISNVNVNHNDNQWYDLSGRRIENPTKGVYIMNGKKVLVK